MITIFNGTTTRSRYIEEILGHAGMPWEHATTNAPLKKLVVVCTPSLLSGDELDRIRAATMDGSGLVLVGGVEGFEDLAGARNAHSILDDHIQEPATSHAVTAAAHEPLHVFGGVSLQPTGGTCLASLAGGGAAIVANRPRSGAIVAIGPDLVWSVHHIQAGTPVHEDADPAPDGSAPLNDDILKAEDGLVLDWTKDRQQTGGKGDVSEGTLGIDVNYPDGDTPWFSVPIADELRDLLLRSITWVASVTGAPLAMVDAWPEGVDAVGMISHDSDLNVDTHALTALDLLDKAGIKSTWCHMWGPTYNDTYERATFEKVKQAGHEIALHYNAFARDGGTWGQEHFTWQADFVRTEAGVDSFTSNKNHYTRWEGSTEFFHWLVEEGIQIDQSRGPSKKGTVGYPFGSCLAVRPLDEGSGAFIDVLELPMQFQDLWLTSPEYQGRTTIRQALRHRGVAHFLFHQIHLHTRPEVAKAFLEVIAAGSEAGLAWWRCEDINRWERGRRRITFDQVGDSIVSSASGSGLKAVGLRLVAEPSVDTVERYGQHWIATTLNHPDQALD